MKTIDQIREEAAAHFNGAKGFDNAERRNAYVCEDIPSFGNSISAKKGCGSFIVTVDHEPGVTPSSITCGNCGNIAGSKFYKVVEWLLTTPDEWPLWMRRAFVLTLPISGPLWCVVFMAVGMGLVTGFAITGAAIGLWNLLWKDHAK